jgi:tungstate transport system permease protein
VDLVWEALGAALGLIVRADPELVRIGGLSLAVSGFATALAAIIGIPFGLALHLARLPGRRAVALAVNVGMGLPPVVVGLVITLLLWRTGPLGGLQLLYTPGAMVLAQLIVAVPLVAGFTRAATGLLDAELAPALRIDGAGERRVGFELARAAWPQVLVAVAAGFGRAISEVGASLMVGGNIVGQTRIFTTAIALETSKGEFALALALGLILLLLALLVNAALGSAAADATATVRGQVGARRRRAPKTVMNM